MSPTTRRVNLSKSDVLYLREASFLPLEFQQQITAGEFNPRVLEVSDALAEECRSVFTERLAIVGFNANYEPTSEGRRLEDLIDKFAESSR